MILGNRGVRAADTLVMNEEDDRDTVKMPIAERLDVQEDAPQESPTMC